MTTLERISEVAGCEVKPSEKLIDLCDSLEAAQLLLDLEEAFGVEFEETKVFTVQDIMNYVERKAIA